MNIVLIFILLLIVYSKIKPRLNKTVIYIVSSVAVDETSSPYISFNNNKLADILDIELSTDFSKIIMKTYFNSKLNISSDSKVIHNYYVGVAE